MSSCSNYRYLEHLNLAPPIQGSMEEHATIHLKLLQEKLEQQKVKR